ncbi:MAG: hypothetical protein RLZZ209_307, partial [Bacteroidota bacterium]
MLLRIILLFCFPIGLYAQSIGRIETDRPDQTECPFIVKKGYFQAEMGFNQSPAETLFPTSLLKIGLTKRLELRYVSVLSKEKDQVTRFQTQAVGFKLALFEPSKWRPRTSVIVHYNWDHQNRDFSEKNLRGHSVGDAVFTFQNDLSDRFGIGYNLG